MADAVTEAAPAASPAPAAATPKKVKAPAKSKAPKAKGEKKVATHPKSAQMVIEAITKLAEKKGSSLIAIKKVIADTHKVDVVKQGTSIKKSLKKLVETGKLTQAKRTGATGSFKLAVAPKPAKKAVGEKKPKAVKAKKAASLKKVKMPAANKAAASPKKVAAAKPKTAVAPIMEFNLMSTHGLWFPFVRLLKRKKRVVSAIRTFDDSSYYPTLHPVFDEDEDTDEDDNEFREKSIDFLFGGDSDLAKNLKEDIPVEVDLITELTLTSSNAGRMMMYTKLENPEDKERDLFEGLFKLQESLPSNSLGLILSLNYFRCIVGHDIYNCSGRYDSSRSSDRIPDHLNFNEEGLKLKRNKGGRVILEMTKIGLPEDGIWWAKWIDGSAEFRVTLSLNVRLDLAAVTELYKRQFKGGPLATEVNTATDLVILVEGNTDKAKGIKCHKSVLSGMSPVLLAMFQTNMLEAREGTWEIKDFSEPVIRALIEFAYRGNVAEALKSFEMTLELLKAADKYEMKDLMDVLLHIVSLMPCAWFEVDLAFNLFIFSKNRGKDLEQAKEKGAIVLKWYAEMYPEKMKDSKMWADMSISRRVTKERLEQLLNSF